MLLVVLSPVDEKIFNGIPLGLIGIMKNWVTLLNVGPQIS